MRDVPAIWEAWRSGVYVGDTKPCTRVTVEEAFYLNTTGPVVGQWDRGPARWFQRQDNSQIETEVPGVMSVSINRSSEPDAGTCDITIRNVTAPDLAAPESPRGQLADLGHYTPDHGDAQDANARWDHSVNRWHNVLVPNALVRTYQGFGGHAKAIPDAVTDGNIVLNGVWLVDDVTINTDGTINLKCRDMMKLLIDQQLVPPLVPPELYPLLYRRWRIEEYAIPADPPPGTDQSCPGGIYLEKGTWSSSTDETYGVFNAGNTGHPPTDAFDSSVDVDWQISGEWPEHQRTYWLSEPMGSPSDTVWIEFDTQNPGLTNQIYYHAWKGALEGVPSHLVMISVLENGDWVPPETNAGGITPQGIPYVCTAVVGTESYPAQLTNLHPLPRDYYASRIRLTITNLIAADDFPSQFRDPDFHGGGFRGGARKLMACFSQGAALYPSLVFTGGAIPVNGEDRYGYWQTKSNGRVFAFGDARAYPNGAGLQHSSPVYGMSVHPNGSGYWTIDAAGRVVAYGDASWHGDMFGFGHADFVDLAPTPSGEGYWLLRRDGTIYYYGDAADHGASSHVATLPSGAPARAQAIESHPTDTGYWVLWSDGFVDAHVLPHLGDANRDGFMPEEWVTSLRRTSTGLGYRILSGRGIVQVFGDATHHGNVTPNDGEIESDRWPFALCWDIIGSSSTDAGYFVQRADGQLYAFGDFQDFGSVGAGQGQLRYDGNYKDYTDIVRDLLLWAGFYLYKNPQPDGEQPDVYGNLEDTGVYSTSDPLPQEMFDKRPVLDAIRDIKAIVGYAFFIDAEGGARWEAPNWWQLGNFLIDGTPYSYMPEIDEAVQLTNHSVVRSGAPARSEIIISTEYPYAMVNGQKPPDAIIKTRIVSTSAPDLKGIISPVIWSNGQFLKPEEQQTMAELIDMQIWFQRRTANIQCVANPLIDVNDQVRIIERQTGEVYIHYIKSIGFTHDLQSGSFTMSLTTHWLGGTPYGQIKYHFATAARPQGDGYWQIAANGDIYAYGAAELHERHEADSHLAWPFAMRSTASGNGYWTLDESGKVLSYGDAVGHGGLVRDAKDAVDLAITPTGEGYWILLRDGTVHPFGDAVFFGNVSVPGSLPSGAPNMARSIESHPTTQGYWVLLADGAVKAINLPHLGDANRDGFQPEEFVTRLRRSASGDGYWVVSGTGLIQNFGDAPYYGSAELRPQANWVLGLVWDMLTYPDDSYGVQHANGTFEMMNIEDLGRPRGATYTLAWALVTQDAHAQLEDPSSAFPVSQATMEFLKNTGSPSAINAATNNFNMPSPAALEGAAP